MIHSERRFPSTVVPEGIRNKFRKISTDYLKENTPKNIVCHECNRKYKNYN